ncbi:MAG: ABC transporter ATP-binding protein [Micropruina sp.]|uniref:ABC transporter ATP-binding protein n=1 Tax=Micropruina sp. TaxID=2737536 RepID=UPI0039E45855
MNALELQDVRHAFGGSPALRGFSLAVAPGEVVAMAGLNGAGKTTAMRVLAGRLRPDAGLARVLGAVSHRLRVDVARRFGQLIGPPLTYGELTVRENLMTAGRLHGLSRAAAREAAGSAIESYRLGRWADRRVSALSAGNWQRLGVACATLHGPDAVILDEPTSALDPAGVVIVRDAVRSLAARGAGVLVSSHHLDEVSRVADRIVVAHAGRLIGTLAPGAEMERRFFAMLLAADADEGADR